MSKIKIAELFYSIQGEGKYMGVPSVFLRTFGCNFTCDSFGMPRGITFETNGSMRLTTAFKEYLLKWTSANWDREVTFSVSAKLPASGEKWEDAICPKVVCEYEQIGTVYLKLVVATETDIVDAERAVTEFKAAGFNGHIYLMPVGGVESIYTLNAKNIALAAMKRGWRYSDRLQVPLFKNEWGT